MRVVHLYDGHERVYRGRGSVPDVVWNDARHVAAAGHDVRVIERQWRGLGVSAVHEGVRFRRIALPTGPDEPWTSIPYEQVRDPGGAARLVLDRTAFALAALRRLPDGFDVLHVHLPFAANVLVTIAPWLRDRVVYTAHLGETERRVTDPRFSPDVYLARRAARTVALNDEMRAAFAARAVPTERLAVVPNGVDLDRFRSVPADRERAVRETYGLADRTVVLFVGTVTPRKRVTDLVGAFETLLAGGAVDPDAVALVVVGNDEIDAAYADRVRERVADAGLADVVTLTGFVPEADLRALYATADVFALPSAEEGSSVAVSEALAAGLPVVGSRIPGIERQVVDGTNGRLHPQGDEVAIARCLEGLIADASLRERQGAASAERAAELAWPRIAERLIAVYREVAEA